MKTVGSLVLCCFAIALGGCGASHSTGTDASTDATHTVKTPVRTSGREPTVIPPGGPPPSQLVIKDLKVGDGPVAHDGDRLTADYVGYDYRSGLQFDNHAHLWGHGEPAVFTLGAGEVIRGWDQGIKGMKVGGRRELIIPPRLAYGNISPPPEVGPGETVIFVVELLGIG
jgi:peptidylprolyl isomerase